MAADQVTIYNLILTKLGERRLTATTDDNENARKLNAVYTDKLAELEEAGPEDGWEFCRERSVAVDVEKGTISAFTDYSGTVTGTTEVTTSAAHNIISGNLVQIDETTNYNGLYEATYVDATNFYIEEAFVADDATGYTYWVSDELGYRFAIPTLAKRITDVRVGGITLPDWHTGNGYIYTALESVTIYVDYIKSVTTTTSMPDYFTNLLVYELIVDMCAVFKKTEAFTQRMERKLEKAWYKAQANNQRKQYVEESSTAWVDAGR